MTLTKNQEYVLLGSQEGKIFVIDSQTGLEVAVLDIGKDKKIKVFFLFCFFVLFCFVLFCFVLFCFVFEAFYSLIFFFLGRNYYDFPIQRQIFDCWGQSWSSFFGFI